MRSTSKPRRSFPAGSSSGGPAIVRAAIVRAAIVRAAIPLAALVLLLAAGIPDPPACAGEPQHRPHVVFDTELGEIEVELYPDRAPITVANFLRYVDRGLYRDATFYRVVRPDNQPSNPVKIEVIQGGLTIEDDYPLRLPPIPHESTAETGLAHGDGTLSMARDEPGTASSEIFITLGEQPELDHGGRRNPDGQGFAAFGRVVRGMEVVRAIQRRPDEGQMLVEPVKILAVRRIEAP